MRKHHEGDTESVFRNVANMFVYVMPRFPLPSAVGPVPGCGDLWRLLLFVVDLLPTGWERDPTHRRLLSLDNFRAKPDVRECGTRDGHGFF